MFGVAFACMSLTNFLFSPFWGKISRNFGPVTSMGLCFIGYAAAQLIFGLSTTEGGIIAARLFGGFFISGISVNQILYIIDNSLPEHRSQNLAIGVTITAVVSAFGYMVGGLLGDISILGTFIAQAIGLFVIGLLCWTIIALLANATICRYLLKHTNINKTIIPVLSICFAMMIAIVMIDNVVPFIVINVVFFGFNAVYQSLLQAMISLLSKGEDGVLVGLYNSMKSLGMVGGSLLAGFIYAIGPKMSFIVSAGSFLLATLFALAYYLHLQGAKKQAKT